MGLFSFDWFTVVFFQVIDWFDFGGMMKDDRCFIIDHGIEQLHPSSFFFGLVSI